MPQTPHFSIVIPTYQRPRHLARLLFSLSSLKYDPGRFEIIVVDDGGDTALEPIISRFWGQFKISFFKQDNSGPAAARNCGAALAQGKYLAFIDDDCVPDSNWLKALTDRFEESPCCICGGRAVNALPDNPYSAATQLLTDYLYEHYKPTEHVGGFFATNNFAVPRTGFVEMGGFDPTMRFGEDRDFCHRWTSRGYPFVFAPEAVIYHAHALSLFSLLQLHFSYGGGTFQFWRRCRIRGLKAVRLSPPIWYLNLVLSGIRKERGAVGLLYTLLLLVIQGACTAGLFWEAVKQRTSFRS